MNAPAASILVVDDEPDLCTLYELTLLREGHRVATASSLQEARQQLRNHRFDAVITDMRLPDGFGMEPRRTCATSNAESAAWSRQPTALRKMRSKPCARAR